jgi:hypothetical protein
VFQGRLINELSPTMAAHMSSHGYAFDRDPPWRARAGDLRLYAQPLTLRKYNFRLKQNGRSYQSNHKELSVPFIESVINPEFSETSNMFVKKNIRDDGQIQRVYVLDYLFRGF